MFNMLIIQLLLFADGSTRCWTVCPPSPYRCPPPHPLWLLLQLRPLPPSRPSSRDRAASACSPTRPGELLSTSTFSSAILSLGRGNWLSQVSSFHLNSTTLSRNRAAPPNESPRILKRSFRNPAKSTTFLFYDL